MVKCKNMLDPWTIHHNNYKLQLNIHMNSKPEFHPWIVHVI
jgi:hypothetical protein